MGAYYGYDDTTMRRHYDEFAKTNKGGYMSFNKYKQTAINVTRNTGLDVRSERYDTPLQYDADSGEKLYTDEEYIKLKADKEKAYFDDVNAAATKEAAQLGGTSSVSVRHAAGSYGNPNEEGYSERIRGNIRKAIGRKG